MADYKSTTEKGECVFCKIISRDIKTPGIFWENDEFMAFLSTWPNTERPHQALNYLTPLAYYEQFKRNKGRILTKDFIPLQT